MSAQYTITDLNLIRELAKTMTARQISEKFERSEKGIQRFALRHGIKFGLVKYRKYTMRDVKSVIDMRNDGATYRDISNKTGVGVSSCKNLYRRYFANI